METVRGRCGRPRPKMGRSLKYEHFPEQDFQGQVRLCRHNENELGEIFL